METKGLGSLKVPSKSSKLEKLDLEVHGRLQSSFSSGLANAAWEWVVKKDIGLDGKTMGKI